MGNTIGYALLYIKVIIYNMQASEPNRTIIIQDVVEYKLNDIILILCLKYEVWQMLGLILLFGIKVVHKTSDFLLQWLCTLLYSSRHN